MQDTTHDDPFPDTMAGDMLLKRSISMLSHGTLDAGVLSRYAPEMSHDAWVELGYRARMHPSIRKAILDDMRHLLPYVLPLPQNTTEELRALAHEHDLDCMALHQLLKDKFGDSEDIPSEWSVRAWLAGRRRTPIRAIFLTRLACSKGDP